MQTEYQRLYYLKNIDKVKARHKIWREMNKDKIKERMREHNALPHIVERRKNTSKVFRETMKNNLFDVLGHKCVKCGFLDKRALQFDHIFGGGNKERKQSNSYQIMKFYNDNPVLAKQKLQVLCANCNWIKKHDEHEHKHNSIMRTTQ